MWKTLHFWVSVQIENVIKKNIFKGYLMERILSFCKSACDISRVCNWWNISCDFSWKEPIFFCSLSLSLSSRTVFNSTSTSWKMRLERYHHRYITDCSLFTDSSNFFSLPPTARLSSGADHQGHTVTVSDIPLSRLSSFSKLCVNYQAMGELEDGWEAGINSAL